MPVDIEDLLARELGKVVADLAVPPVPALPRVDARRYRFRHPLLVAAVVLLIVAAAFAMEAIQGTSRAPEPAPPSPTRSQRGDVELLTTAPTTTYELNHKLYVGGRQVPGTWLWVGAGQAGWVGMRDDQSWWVSRGDGAVEIEDTDREPGISPSGEYAAAVLGTSGEGDLVGFETGSGGRSLGATPIELGESDAGGPVRVRAVLDDGRIIAQGAGAAILWLPLRGGDDKVDLSRTAPGQEVRYNTPAGLVVTEGLGGTPYLAEISDEGRLDKVRGLPSENVVVSPGTAWFAWTPSVPPGGDVMRLPTLRAQSLNGADEVRWTSPGGWEFRAGEWAWEDDEHLVSPVARDDGPMGERLARCSVRAARCVLIASP